MFNPSAFISAVLLIWFVFLFDCFVVVSSLVSPHHGMRFIGKEIFLNCDKITRDQILKWTEKNRSSHIKSDCCIKLHSKCIKSTEICDVPLDHFYFHDNHSFLILTHADVNFKRKKFTPHFCYSIFSLVFFQYEVNSRSYVSQMENKLCKKIQTRTEFKLLTTRWNSSSWSANMW